MRIGIGMGAHCVSKAAANQVQKAAPVSQVAPVAQGSAVRGSVLQCGKGQWSGNPQSYAYQWYNSVNGGATWLLIAGANTNTYTTTVGLVGSLVRCEVLATNATGTSAATGKSNSIGPIT